MDGIDFYRRTDVGKIWHKIAEAGVCKAIF